MGGESKIFVWDVEIWEVCYILEGYFQVIQVIVISLDDKIFVSSGKDGKINLWDMDSGKLLRSINGLGKIVFSFDGQQFVIVVEDNVIQFW